MPKAERVRFIQGDCRDVLRTLDAGSVPWHLGYLAALIDAECHVGIQKLMGGARRTPSYSIRFELAMTDKVTVDFVNSLLPTAKVVHCVARERRLPYYRLRLRGQEAISLLRTVLPYVQGKRRQIEICLEIDAIRRRLSPSRKLPFGVARRMPAEFVELVNPLFKEFRLRQLNKKPKSLRCQ